MASTPEDRLARIAEGDQEALFQSMLDALVEDMKTEGRHVYDIVYVLEKEELASAKQIVTALDRAGFNPKPEEPVKPVDLDTTEHARDITARKEGEIVRVTLEGTDYFFKSHSKTPGRMLPYKKAEFRAKLKRLVALNNWNKEHPLPS